MGNDDDQLIIGIKCALYSFDVLMENIHLVQPQNMEQYETRIKRLYQHFNIMEESMDQIFVISDTLNNEQINDKLNILQLSDTFKYDQYEIIGNDHEWIRDCNQNIQLMIVQLIKRLKIQSDEMLFISNRKGLQLMKTLNICQIYDVDGNRGGNDSNKKVKGNGALKGRDLMFLESQVLASI